LPGQRRIYAWLCKNILFSNDSKLNVVYFKLRLTLNTTQREKFKIDQKIGLRNGTLISKGDLKSLKTVIQTFPLMVLKGAAQDDGMFMYDDNAEFVKARVLELLKELNK